MECYYRNRPIMVLALTLMVVFGCLDGNVLGEVRVTIQNRLGTPIAIRCRSRDDDLGDQVVQSGYELKWSFDVNIWGTTLFYCDVQWDGARWHHFDAFSYARDSERCVTECVWIINRDEDLYVYNQNDQRWEWVNF